MNNNNKVSTHVVTGVVRLSYDIGVAKVTDDRS